MSAKQRRRAGRESAGVQHVRIEHELIDSAAWRRLSAQAVKAFVLLKRTWRPGGFYSLTAPSVQGIMSSHTRQRALAELVEAGLFDHVQRGGFSSGPAIYRDSERWRVRSAALAADIAQVHGQARLWTRPKRAVSAASQKNLELARLRAAATAKHPKPLKVSPFELADVPGKPKPSSGRARQQGVAAQHVPPGPKKSPASCGQASERIHGGKAAEREARAGMEA